jgi:hypothetical protein
MIDKLGGRKAIIAVLIVALGVGAVLLKNDIPTNFEHLLEIIFGTFVLGNVTNTVVATRAGAIDSDTTQPAPAPDFSPITAELQAIKAQNETITQALSTSQQGIGFLCSYVSQQMQAPAPVGTQAAKNRAIIEQITD